MDANTTFKNKVQEKIAKDLVASKTLLHAAEDLRAKGDFEGYWNLTVPRNLAELYYLIDDFDAFSAQLATDISYYQNFKKWEVATNNPDVDLLSKQEARIHLFMGHPEKALPIYNFWVTRAQDELAKGMYGIRLIVSGQVEGGKELLRNRVAILSKDADMSPTKCHHLAECLLWLGDYEQALVFSTQAVTSWPTLVTKPPVEALYHLLTYLVHQDVAAQSNAVILFEKAMQSFYYANDIVHAVDAHEYRLLALTWKAGDPYRKWIKIAGLSFLV